VAVTTSSERVEAAGEVARHIARAAACLFAARGYDATPVRAIVEAAGVTKPTLYYHFGSKEGLAQALVTRPLTRLVETLRREIREQPDAIRALEAMLECHFAFCVEDPDRSRFVYALFFGPLGSGLASELCRFGQQLDETWLMVSRRLAESGIINPSRVRDFVASLRGLIIVHTVDYLYRGQELGPGLAPRLIDDLLSGFGHHGHKGR
jgi:AcrR family transcriptional regulator